MEIDKYTLKLQSPYEEGKEIKLVPIKAQYQKSGTLAVSLYDIENEGEYATLSTNVMGGLSDINSKNLALVDTNNCFWGIKLIEDNKLGEATGHTAKSGFCEYPEYIFDTSKMIDYNQLENYLNAKDNNLSSAKEQIRVVYKEPNKPYEVKMIDNEFHTLQKMVDGIIDMTPLPTDDSIDICCNDEFLYNGMEANIVTPEREGVMCGPLIFMGYNEEDGSSVSLNDDQLKRTIKYIERNQVHNMTVESAYRYSLVMKDFQAAEDQLHKSSSEMEM